jgi:hypothetical protein
MLKQGRKMAAVFKYLKSGQAKEGEEVFYILQGSELGPIKCKGK